MKHLRRIVILLLVAGATVLLMGCPDASLLGALGGPKIAVYLDGYGDLTQGDVIDYGILNFGSFDWFEFEIWNDGSEPLVLEAVLATPDVYVEGLGGIGIDDWQLSYTIAAGDFSIVDVDMDANGSAGPLYWSAVTIHSNDPLIPVFVFYVTFEEF